MKIKSIVFLLFLCFNALHSFVLLIFLTIFFVFPVFADPPQRFEAFFQETQIDFGYTTGKFISIDKYYSQIGLFAPLSLSNGYTPFFDMRGYRFNDGKWAANAGFGIRKNLSEIEAIGINAYYDYRRGEYTHNFHQIGLGLEWLNRCWDMRVNGYLPLSQKKQTSDFCNFDQFGDGFFATRRKIESSYAGFDAEVGLPLLSYCDFNLYGAAGTYYYQSHHQNHFWGGCARLKLDWKSTLSFQVRISYDRVYSVNTQGIVQISFPLDFFCSAMCKDNPKCPHFINQQVQRNGIILTDRCCDWTWNWNDKN